MDKGFDVLLHSLSMLTMLYGYILGMTKRKYIKHIRDLAYTLSVLYIELSVLYIEYRWYIERQNSIPDIVYRVIYHRIYLIQSVISDVFLDDKYSCHAYINYMILFKTR